MRKHILVLFILLLCKVTYGQSDKLKEKLYSLREKVEAGDKDALIEVAKFIDDTTFIQEWLGYHNYPNTARGVAGRILEENCLFTFDELQFDTSVTARKVLQILQSEKTYFDDLSGQFLATPLQNRNTSYELRKSAESDLRHVDTVVIQHPFPDWYYENQIDWFLKNKDPQALKWIASAWYKKRSRFNVYYFNDNEFLDLMKKLTRIELGVPGENSKITFLYNDDYYAKARVNYLIYWTNHYKDYKWSDELGYFVNTAEQTKEKEKEAVLFSFLNRENDSLALDAFIQLTEFDTAKVNLLAADYEKDDLNSNNALPTFPYRFLRQTTRLTQYCRDNKITYKAKGWLLDSLNKLKSEIHFSERYQLENNLVHKLSLQEITSVEYFGLVYEQEWDLTYSLGRVLDKFYSRQWQSTVSDQKALAHYLKKSKLFDDVGIIGILNKYLRKFENSPKRVLDTVAELATETLDADIKEQALTVLSLYSKPVKYVLENPKKWEGNKAVYGVPDLHKKYKKIINSKQKDDEKKHAIEKLIGKIDYGQIKEMIAILKKDTILGNYDKYSFLETDFGFPIDPDDSMAIEEFIANYSTKSHEQLCKFYLVKNGMNYAKENGEFLYDRIFEMLKYDVVDAFAGGGGGRRDDCVYLLIKLLELRFNTRLGYSTKLCSSQGIYSCDCTDQAKAWMHYLVENNLTSPNKAEPVSISSNK